MLVMADVSTHHALIAGPGGTLAGVAVTKNPSCQGLLAGSLGIEAVWNGGAGRPQMSSAGRAHVAFGECGDRAEGRSLVESAVKDVMTTSVLAIGESARYKDIIVAMRQRRVSACPVLDAVGRVVGAMCEAGLLAKEAGPEPFSGPGGSLRASGRRGERAKAAGETAAELMSAPPITIGPGASVADAARLMHERGVKRLPVVDGAGRLVGIVSRIDVLSVFTKPGSQIRSDVLQQVIAGKLALDPAAFGVTVTSGVVTVTGQVERHAVAVDLIDAVRHAGGVVGVRDRVSYPPESLPPAAAHVSSYPHAETVTDTTPPGDNRRANPRR